jgi:hypothetical protein
MASSIAWVAPFPEDGRYECAASPTWITRAPGDAQFCCGFRHHKPKLTIVSGGVVLTSFLKISAHGGPGMSSIPFSTSSASMVLLQLSFSEPVT